MRRLVVVGFVSLLAVSGATAACPSQVPGTTGEAIAANQQRLVCLQQQALEASERRQRDLELRMLDNRLNQLEIQRRFDALPVYRPPVLPGQ